MVFAGRQPSWQCRSSPSQSLTSASTSFSNAALNITATGFANVAASRRVLNFFQQLQEEPMNCSPTVTDMCTMDSSLWEWVGGKGVSTVSEWNLVCGDEYKRGLAQSVFFIGGLFGAGVFGNLSDSVLGRKGAFVCAATAISGLITAASTSEVTIANCVSGYVLNHREQAASWKCNFFSEHNVLDYVKQGDDGAYKRLKSSGIFNTFWPFIVSLWGNLDDKHEACPYEFKTKRDIISIQDEIKRRSMQAIQDHAPTPAFVPTPEPKLQHSWRFWSKKQTLAAPQDFPVPEISTVSQNLQQVYEKTMCVNIAMTHVIHDYKLSELHGQENKPDTGITIGVQGPLQVNAETG